VIITPSLSLYGKLHHANKEFAITNPTLYSEKTSLITITSTYNVNIEREWKFTGLRKQSGM
jgi:hypothetical protein